MNNGEHGSRWGIPGWSVIISLILFICFDFIGGGGNKILNIVKSMIDDSDILELAICGIVVAGAGIPIGYFLYQIYFYFRWNSPWSKEGPLSPVIGGRHKSYPTRKGDNN